MTALSVVFPRYNEADRLPATLEAYLEHLPRAAGGVEVLVLARRLGLAVAEVPVRARPRAGGKVRVLADGRRMVARLWTIRRSEADDGRGAAEDAGDAAAPPLTQASR
jgi:hypothetical protein